VYSEGTQPGEIPFYDERTDCLNQLLILQSFQSPATDQMDTPVDTFQPGYKSFDHYSRLGRSK
jgi:hypothetical protein